MVVLSKFPSVFMLLVLLSVVFNSNAQTDSLRTDKIELNIFPNPNQGVFYITTFKNESYKSQLYSMDGKMVKVISINSGRNYIKLDLPAGIYLLVVSKGDRKEEFKIVIN